MVMFFFLQVKAEICPFRVDAELAFSFLKATKYITQNCREEEKYFSKFKEHYISTYYLLPSLNIWSTSMEEVVQIARRVKIEV